MKKLLLSSLFVCLFTMHNVSIAAQQKTNQTPQTNTNPVASSAITVNQKIGSWDIHCAYPSSNNNKQTNASQGCIAYQNLMVTDKDKKQTPIASLLLERIKDNKNPTQSNSFRLTVITPLGFSLQHPVSLVIDQNTQITLPWVACTSNGCITSETINNTLQKSLETNKTAHLIIHRVNNTTVTINFNIAELPSVFATINELINKKSL